MGERKKEEEGGDRVIAPLPTPPPPPPPNHGGPTVKKRRRRRFLFRVYGLPVLNCGYAAVRTLIHTHTSLCQREEEGILRRSRVGYASFF